MFVLWSMESVDAFTMISRNGKVIIHDSAHGSVVGVDQNKRSFTLQWSTKGGRMKNKTESKEHTFVVTDQTVYKGGSWADVKTGVQVKVSAKTDSADIIEFLK